MARGADRNSVACGFNSCHLHDASSPRPRSSVERATVSETVGHWFESSRGYGVRITAHEPRATTIAGLGGSTPAATEVFVLGEGFSRPPKWPGVSGCATWTSRHQRDRPGGQVARSATGSRTRHDRAGRCSALMSRRAIHVATNWHCLVWISGDAPRRVLPLAATNMTIAALGGARFTRSSNGAGRPTSSVEIVQVCMDEAGHRPRSQAQGEVMRSAMAMRCRRTKAELDPRRYSTPGPVTGHIGPMCSSIVSWVTTQ